MIDFHSHILPGIDDGSKDTEETRELITTEIKDGVKMIIATPHFYASKTSASRYLEKRDACEARMRECIEHMSDAPEVRVGAEVYYFPGMAKADILDDLCIQGTRVLLVEMPFSQWDESCYKDIKDLIRKRKYHVILAHVERYVEFQKKKGVWEDIMDLPLTKQINAGSFLKKGFFDKKYKWAMNFLKQHDHVVIGTDCHNMTSRKPNLLAGREAIGKALGAERLHRIDEVGAQLLEKNRIV